MTNFACEDASVLVAAPSPLLRGAMDMMEGVFLAFTLEGKILQWNRHLEEASGYEEEEIDEMNVTDLIAQEASAEKTGQIAELLDKSSGEKQIQFESSLLTRQGERVPYAFTASRFDQNGETGNGGTVICLGKRSPPGGERAVRQRTERSEEAPEKETVTRESEKRYRQLFEEAQEGIAITTPEGDILSVNPAAKAIFGYEEEELTDLNTADLYADPKERVGVLKELRGEGAISQREVRFQRAGGEEIVCEISVTVQDTGGGTPVALLTLFREVTERKKAEEALRESEEQFRKLSENALVGISLVQDGVYKYVNPALAQITGYSREELIGASPKLAVHPEDWPGVRKQLEKRLEGKAEDVRYEARVRTKSGETRHVDVSGTRVTYRGDLALIATAQDITEWKKVKEALEKSERRFRSLAEEAPIGISLQGEEGYIYANSAFEEIFGRKQEEILGRFPKDLYHIEDWPDVERWADEILSGKRESIQARVRTNRTEEVRHIQIYAGRVTYREQPALIWAVVDVTERVQLQEEIVQVQEEERRRIGQDLHDSLASQLTGVNLMLTTISSNLQEEEAKEGIEEVQELISESANDVRRLSHGLNPTGLSEGDLVSVLRGFAEAHEAHFTYESLSERKGASEPGEFDLEEADATHLYRIAQEAVANASRHGEASKIEIRLRECEETILLEVEDDGKGFDREEISEGLGLRSMRHRAELSGAELRLESSAGEGTLVRCTLPL